MTGATRSILKTVLRLGSWLMFGTAGIAFWVGGRAIHEFARVDRILAEGLGLLVALVTGMIGYVLKTTADEFDTDEDSTDR